MKILFFDVETTGLDPVKNDIIQIAGIIEIDGQIKEEFNIKMQPMDYSTVEQGALDVNGITIEEIKTYQYAKEGYEQLLKIFDKYVYKFNKKDKFIPAGYNVAFDVNFLFEFFKKQKNLYCGSYLNYHKIDPLPVLLMLSLKGTLKLDSFKLVDVCKALEIPLLDAHDAMADIKATRDLTLRILEYLK